MDGTRVIARVTVVGETRLIPAIRSFVRDVASAEGLAEADAGGLELVAEEACLNAVRHALSGKESGTYTVSLERRPAEFVLAVEDAGLPLDWDRIERGEGISIGMQLMKGLSDRIRFINLGRGGKRLEFVKDSFMPGPENSGIEDPAWNGPGGEAAPPDAPIQIRPMLPSDGAALARCMYRVYGYTYRDFVYHPEKVAEKLAEGLLISTVATDAEGEVIAHQGLVKEQKDAPVAEIAMGVVDPRYRGRGLFERIKAVAFAQLAKEGVLGLFGEAVANHPYSQKANSALGGRETGVLLGFISPHTLFKSIGDTGEERTSAVLFYNKLNDGPRRTVYAPPEHAGIIERIYSHTGVERTLADPPVTAPEALPQLTELDVKAVPDMGLGALQLRSCGTDLPRVLRARLREMCLAKIECIHLDIRLSDPCAPFACAAAEALGFGFAGVLPEYRDGDVLRLQYLSNVTVTPEKIVVVSEFARLLFAYVLERSSSFE